MALNLSGKYMTVNELERLLGKSAWSLYPILNSMQGVVKIGSSYLIPEALLPELRHKVALIDSHALATAAARVGVNQCFLNDMANSGLPFLRDQHGNTRIRKQDIPAIKKAVKLLKGKYGALGSEHIKEAADLAIEFIRQ